MAGTARSGAVGRRATLLVPWGKFGLARTWHHRATALAEIPARPSREEIFDFRLLIVRRSRSKIRPAGPAPTCRNSPVVGTFRCAVGPTACATGGRAHAKPQRTMFNCGERPPRRGKLRGAEDDEKVVTPRSPRRPPGYEEYNSGIFGAGHRWPSAGRRGD